MKIRNKILIILLLSWVVILIFMYLVSQFVIKKSYINLEETAAVNNLERVNQAINLMGDSVYSVLGSWAIWDDTYHFMVDKNDNYIQSNLQISSFTSSDIDMVLYFDTQGKPFYTVVADTSRTKEVPLPAGMSNYLLPSGKIVHQPYITSGMKGIISIPSGLIMIASHSIVTSKSKGPVHGTILMGRYFTATSLAKLRDITKVNVDIFRMEKINNNIDLLNTNNELKNNKPYIFNKTDSHTMVIYSYLKDVNDQPIAILKIYMPRSIYQVGLKTIYYYNMIAFFSSIFFGFILWSILKIIVVYRIERLKNDVLTSSSNKDLPNLNKGVVDELSSVALLYYHATHDPLTGLGNRHLINIAFQNYSKNRTGDHKIAIIFIDLDNFKYVNDTCGHIIGDKLLVQISAQLTASIRSNDLAVRLGGDEFVVMLFNIDHYQIDLMIRRLFAKLNKEFVIEGHNLYVTCSMGVSLYPGDGADVDTLLRNADIALYEAKSLGRNRSRYYSVEIEKSIQAASKNELELQQAIDNNELLLYYQPIYNTLTQKIIKVEALIRWQHPNRGLLSPCDIIPLAEKTGLIVPVGKWVLKTACDQAKHWQDLKLAPIPVAVNISLLQIKNFSIYEMITEMLRETGLAPEFLELELTETSYIEVTEEIIQELQSLKDLGVHLSIDDFGMGYSGLRYLSRLPVNNLKIDASFIRNISQRDDRAIVLAIITIAHQLSFTVTAEGVETQEQFDFLKMNKVDAIQGYYFSQPLDANDYQKLIMTVESQT